MSGCFDNALFWVLVCAPSVSDIPYNTISYVHWEHTRADPLNKKSYYYAVLHSLSLFNISAYPDWNDWHKIYTSVSRFWLPSSHWSASAWANQTHFTNRAICLNGEAGLWCWCASARMHIQMYAEDVWTLLHNSNTGLYLILCNVKQLWGSLTGRIRGTLSYVHRLYIQNSSILCLQCTSVLSSVFSSNNVSQLFVVLPKIKLWQPLCNDKGWREI